MQKAVKISLEGKTSGNGQIDRIIMILKKKLILGVILTLPWGYINVNYPFSQTILLVYVSQTFVEY